MRIIISIKRKPTNIVIDKINNIFTENGYLIIYYFNEKGFYTACKIRLEKITGAYLYNTDSNMFVGFTLEAIKEIE